MVSRASRAGGVTRRIADRRVFRIACASAAARACARRTCAQLNRDDPSVYGSDGPRRRRARDFSVFNDRSGAAGLTRRALYDSVRNAAEPAIVREAARVGPLERPVQQSAAFERWGVAKLVRQRTLNPPCVGSNPAAPGDGRRRDDAPRCTATESPSRGFRCGRRSSLPPSMAPLLVGACCSARRHASAKKKKQNAGASVAERRRGSPLSSRHRDPLTEKKKRRRGRP